MILARRALRPAAGWRRTVLAAAPVPLALIGGLGAPMAYSMDTAATTQSGAVPSAGPTVAGSFGIPGARSGFPGGADRRLPAGAGGGIRRAGQYQRHCGQAAGGRGVRLPMGRGHGQLHQRGLDRTGQQRRPGHGDRRFLRIRPGAEPGRVREARLRAPDPLLRERRRGWRVQRVRRPPGESGASRASDFAASPDGGAPAGFAAAGGPGGGSGDASQITSWVEAHFKSETVGGTTVYDLSSPKAGGAGSAGTGSAGTRTAPPGAGPGTGTMPAKPPAEGGFPPPQ